MNDTNASFFKNKNTFKALVDRFEYPSSSINIYNAEMSSDDKIGIVDNNILLTIKKSFPINSKIKFNNGKIYTIIDSKWEPGKWVKKTSSEIDKIDKIKNISKKKLRTYDISSDVVKQNIPKKINLSYEEFNKTDNVDNIYNIHTITEPQDVTKVFESMNFFSDKNKIIITETKNEEHDQLKNFFSNKSMMSTTSIATEKNEFISGAVIEIQENSKNISILDEYNIKFIDNFYNLFSSSVIDNNFYSFPFITDVRNSYNKFTIDDDNIKKIIEVKINNDENDEKYNLNLMKLYDEITKNNQLYSDFLKFELIFLKTCYNYYYLYNKIKKEMDETNENLKTKILEVFNKYEIPIQISESKEINTSSMKNLTEKLYNFKYLYEYYKLMYNYYLYGLYWWIVLHIKIFNNDAIFTKEKIIPSYFSGKSTIDQKKYESIINDKHEVFLEILDSIVKLKNFYKNNETIEIFRKNKLISMLFEDNNTLLYSELQKKITNNDKEYKFIDVKNDKECFLYCLLYALKDKINLDNYPSYDKNIIQSFLNANIKKKEDSVVELTESIEYESVDDLRNNIIDSIEFRVEYYRIKKEKNLDNFIHLLSNNNDEFKKLKQIKTHDEIFEYLKGDYFFNYFIIRVISQIFNCMFYIYSSINGNPTFKNITEYNNQPYSIIFYKNNNCYKLITYKNNGAMNCRELPEELKISQFCYEELESSIIAEPIGQELVMIGGASIDDIKQKINDKLVSIQSSENLTERYNREIQSEKNKYNITILPEEKNKIKYNIENIEKNIMINNEKLTEYYKENIKNYNNLITEYNNDKNRYINELYNVNNKIKIYKNKLNKLENIINLEKEKYKKVYGVVVDLILYPGDNPNIIDKQKYKCKKSFDDLKNEYCEVFGIGCTEKDKKNGGTIKNKIINKKKYTMKNKII